MGDVTGWIQTKLTDQRISELTDRPDEHVSFPVSPYDIPEAVRCYDNKRTGMFVIEFRYIGGPEPSRVLTVDFKPLVAHMMKLHVGKHSDRLYRIEVEASALKAHKVDDVDQSDYELLLERVNEAVLKLIKIAYQIVGQVRNLKIAQEAFQQAAEEVGSPMDVLTTV